MTWLLLAACAAAFGYQVTALLACLRHLRRRDPEPHAFPPVSILKPVRGRDPDFYASIRSHALQQYPGGFEILFGVADPSDPCVADIERLRAEFPAVPISLVHSTTAALNGKVGVLVDLARQARHSVWLVNDSDIRVPQGYLRSVVAPLEDPRIGVVTCLYRATARTLPGLWEALGIVTDFAPSTLVAPFVGVKEFGLGSTLVFRRADLDRIGGFEALAEYIADDYQLARRITGLGLRVHLSRTVVETTLGGESWDAVWRHQLRWHRTIRVSRGAYVGLPVTHASLWAAVAALGGHWGVAGLLICTRLLMALTAGWNVLRSPVAARLWPLVPLRDLWGSVVWAVGLFGSTVQWRDRTLTLLADGRIQASASNSTPE